MKIIHVLTICTVFAYTNVLNANDWGKTGHRTVGAIAEQYLSKKTKRNINKLLYHSGLSLVSTFSDDIRSDEKYNTYKTWHYVNFPTARRYGDVSRDKKGDIIQGVKKCILIIRSEAVEDEEKAFYLKMLVHLVGDLHQPLHVGRGEDRGGNTIKVKWYDEESNLHRVWDSNMINNYKMSYSELASNADYKTKEEIKKIEKGTLIDWAKESQKLANKVYSTAKEGDELRYAYMYQNFPLVRQQLQVGGIRLARILNEIFKRNSDWLECFLKDTAKT